MVLSHDQNMKEKLDGAAKAEYERAEAARVLWEKAAGMVVTHSGGSNRGIMSFSGKVMKDDIRSQGLFYALFGLEKKVSTDSVFYEIPDEKGELVSITSCSVKSFGKEEVKGISISLSDSLAVFLKKRGKKIDIETREADGELMDSWHIKTQDVSTALSLASSKLDLLQKNISSKNS
jgi:hypothetical protein